MSTTNNRLAQGIEVFIANLQEGQQGQKGQKGQQKVKSTPDFDVVIIGSGYGGAVAASRLARVRTADGKPLSVCVLERGREYLPGDFPDSLAKLPAEIRFQRSDAKEAQGNAQGLFDLHLNDDVAILRANGLGGGSLINASVAERMSPAIWKDEHWPKRLRNEAAQFDQYYLRAEKMLRLAQLPSQEWYGKTQQLQRLGTKIDKKGEHSFRPVQLAVKLATGDNPYGIAQSVCVGCGDCFTGCNYNAKNTLTTNYLADAKRFGAHLYTGATVFRVSQIQSNQPAQPAQPAQEPLWQLDFGLSDSPNTNARAQRFGMTARMVIIAAGTLGSTEILMRSKQQGLTLSAQLGTRFSGNGDMIWAGFNQDQEVKVGAPQAQPFGERKVGPTISAMLDLRQHKTHPVVIQDAAIPASMYHFFGELITTTSLLYRMAQSSPDETGPLAIDPDAVHPEQIARTAVYLSMGRDAGDGKFVFIADGDKAGCVRIQWQHANQHKQYAATEKILRAGVKKLGGTFLTNPMWRAYPEELNSALAGKKPTQTLITVHPLGGCPMAETHLKGVVNDEGAVFDCVDRTSVYDGLFVWDGSIIPASIGINPLLTITALAERAVQKCIQANGWQIDFDAPPRAIAPRAQTNTQDALPTPAPVAAVRRSHFKFAEDMLGEIKLPPNLVKGKQVHPAQKRFNQPGLQVNFNFDVDLPEFLRNPQRALAIDDARLTLEDGTEIAMVGRVEWLHLVPKARASKIKTAIGTYATLRAWADWLGTHEGDPADKNTLQKFQEKMKRLARFRSFGKLASHIGGLRELRYVLRPAIAGKNGVAPWELKGVKRVEYAVGNNLWRSLSDLDVAIIDAKGKTYPKAVLKLNWRDLLDNNAMQLVQCEENIYAWQDLASMAGFFLRAVFRLHFWSFRKPDYDYKERKFPHPGPLTGLTTPTHYAVPVNTLPDDTNLATRPPGIELTHYPAAVKLAKALPPIILIHGFGASGLQFTTGLMKQNLTQHLCQQGRDVWVLELRTSIALPTSYEQWSLDDVAQNDIPAAVRFVLAHYKGKFAALDVIAHCIGSAMFNIAVLSGRLQNNTDGGGQSLIRAAVMLQVGPVFKVSKPNRIRAAAAKWMRDGMNFSIVDSSVDGETADWKATLLDRLLATFPIPGDEAAKLSTPLGTPVRTDLANYYRSTAVFGRLFQHDNLSPAMRNALGDLLGHTNLRTYQQILHAVLQERLVDQYGRNIYLTQDNITSFYRFPALFLFGEENDVFDRACTKESADLLGSIFSPDLFRFEELKGFGHLDPLIGIHAAKQVFPKMSGFLAQAPVFKFKPKTVAAPSYYRCKPELGPIIGWTRHNPTGDGLLCRIWVKAKERTQAIDLVETILLDSHGKVLINSYQAHKVLAYPHFTIAVCDVALPGAGPYQILCCTRYHAHSQQAATAETKLIPAIPDMATMMRAIEHESGGMAVLNIRQSGQQLATAWQSVPENFATVVLASTTTAALCQPDSASTLCFALGSCRYSGTPLEIERGDQAFAKLDHLLDQAEQADGVGELQPAFVLMMGDQIYVDANAGVLDCQLRPELVLERYHEAWSSPAAARLLGRLPGYMILDDHEIKNDWEPALYPQDFRDSRAEQMAQAAYAANQWAFSPRNGFAQASNPANSGDPRARHMWYHFEMAGFPFFVLDTRLEREPRHYTLSADPAINRPTIMSATQMQALATWLDQCQQKYPDRPKFIVSPTALSPIQADHIGPCRSQSDGWQAYPQSLYDLGNLILQAGANHLVWLAGDLHASFASKITFGNPQGASASMYSLVFSPQYAPYSFINTQTDEVLEHWQETIPGSNGNITWAYDNLWVDDAYQGFGLLQINKTDSGWQIRIDSPDGKIKPFDFAL